MTRLAIILLYVLTSTTFGFAHRFAISPDRPDLTQYALPDGTLPFICGHFGGDGKGDNTDHTQLCDACCLAAAPGLALPPAVNFQLSASAAVIVWSPQRTFTQSFWTVAALGARGPPAAQLA